jgi:UDP-N-acetylmuramoyl-tripeptide--D-alanyl-D-alanine ligase
MIRARASEIAGWLGIPPPTCGDPVIRGVGTDTRELKPGFLFVALRGARHDGHAFAAEAQARGASALMVARQVAADLPQLVVADTVASLGALALTWRACFHLQAVAVGGSNGKTTVKDILGAILRRAFPRKVLVTQGNLNNHIGVPLTLLRIAPRHRFAVIELRANHFGEIGYLSGLLRPAVVVMTNAGLDHSAGFAGPEGAARANGEVFSAMDPHGLAVRPADDPCCPIRLRMATARGIVTFGCGLGSDVRGTWQAKRWGGRLEVVSPWGPFVAEVPLLGRHNGRNALAAASAALALGVSARVIADALAGLQAPPGQMQLKRGAGGLRIIDDTYNATPSSFAAALEVLAASESEKVLVMGDMAELGDAAASWHTWVGEKARQRGIDGLYAFGELSRRAVQAFGARARHFPNQRLLIAALQQSLRRSARSW